MKCRKYDYIYFLQVYSHHYHESSISWIRSGYANNKLQRSRSHITYYLNTIFTSLLVTSEFKLPT